MASNSHNILWEAEINNIVFKTDKVQDLNINQLKLECMIDIKKMKT